MSSRRLAIIAVLLIALGGLLLVRHVRKHEASPAPAGPASRPTPAPHRTGASTTPVESTPFPLTTRLNAADSTVGQDLDILQQLLDAWRSNFPREGNPVGENSEIVAALTGANRLNLALLSPRHPAINGNGELCDRWGTPYRFHQLGGEQMEIRSAGPDRRFATEDDAILTPP